MQFDTESAHVNLLGTLKRLPFRSSTCLAANENMRIVLVLQVREGGLFTVEGASSGDRAGAEVGRAQANCQVDIISDNHGDVLSCISSVSAVTLLSYQISCRCMTAKMKSIQQKQTLNHIISYTRCKLRYAMCKNFLFLD